MHDPDTDTARETQAQLVKQRVSELEGLIAGSKRASTATPRRVSSGAVTESNSAADESAGGVQARPTSPQSHSDSCVHGSATQETDPEEEEEEEEEEEVDPADMCAGRSPKIQTAMEPSTLPVTHEENQSLSTTPEARGRCSVSLLVAAFLAVLVAAIVQLVPLEVLDGSSVSHWLEQQKQNRTMIISDSDSVSGQSRKEEVPGGDTASAVQATPPQVVGSSIHAANISATVKGLWKRGVEQLQLSACETASDLFKDALALLHNSSDPTDVTTLDYPLLVCDQGFALICARRYEEGARFLESNLVKGLRQSPPHIVNALGYAYFYLKDYLRAFEVFRLGTQVDEKNPIMWNNLASTCIVQRDFRLADESLIRAVDEGKHNLKGDEEHSYYQQLFHSNIEALANHASGKTERLPHVELWYTEGTV